MNVIFETERLILKVFEEIDVEDAKEFWGNEEVMEHCLGAVPHDVLPKVLDSYAKCHLVNHLSIYAVYEKSTNKVIGGAGFIVRDSIDQVELVYHFAKGAWGKGYATEAGNACLEIARKNGKVKKIYASADSKNSSSLKILEKMGFNYQGLKWFEDTEQEEPYYELVLAK
ncbi:GNAT family N-acetyltransferase [Bacillus sp. 31A1R]|uniref:GNAT family N-acetyltransferase n=1 Tax=Robertmurraya mangrovi TaxID=3098077 RepID=A0ABU5IWG3_9BACI|nr:GNAT family N-acetyltransferase [Bacillus sp. 31A1R]MDZ5471488.1 GNAT family N-acetyltransferase [Bacillus sp. 31A1R]